MSGEVVDIYPLSPMQQGMLFHALEDESGEGFYLEQVVLELQGSLSVPLLRQAWAYVIRRHTALRTAFEWQEVDEPLQIVLSEADPAWDVFDLRALEDTAQKERVSAYLEKDRRRGIPLDDPPLMRFALFRLGETRWRLVWTHHHLLLDGWSLPVIFGEVWQAMEALGAGRTPSLPPARPYRDYIAWLKRQDSEVARQFWQSVLDGVQSPTPLPPGYPGVVVSPQPDRRERPIPPALQEAIQSLARRCHVTPGAIHQATWGLLLARFSGSDTAVFGATTSGRSADIPAIERMVGLFINTLPVRVDVTEMPVSAWLQKLQQQVSEARGFEYCSLHQIQQWSMVPAGIPLFNSIMVIENYPAPAEGMDSESGIAITDFYGVERTNFPLTVAVMPNDQPAVRIEFDTGRYHPEVVDGLLDCYLTILGEMVRRPEASPAELATLSEAVFERVVVLWNQTATALPADRLVHECFAEFADRTPDAAAIVTEERVLSFRQANEAANRLAWWLRGAGIRRGDPVGVLMPRSPASVLAALAIFKAGGIYLPLDPRLPRERLATMIADTGARVVLSDGAVHTGLATHEIDGLAGPLSACSPENPPPVTTTADLAYIIYTSGSTGAPKGTLVPHTGLFNLARAQAAMFGLGPTSRMLHFASLAFDAAVAEMVVTWVCGAALCILSGDGAQAGDRLLDSLERLQVNVAKMPPSLWAVLSPRRLPTLHTILMVGEAADPTVVARWARYVRVINAYGPTETTVCATMACCDPASPAPPPIGPPMANVRAYILDARLQPCVPGMPGELYLGGIGVALGYLHRPDLTAARFMPDPFSASPGARLYRTGDLARWRPDGQIEFLGRCDNQVKIRGFRIEPGEVETALRACPGVSDAAVVSWRPPNGASPRLVAYIVEQEEEGEPGASSHSRVFSLRDRLAEKLPAYMIPAYFVPLRELPRTVSGKVDRRILPPPPHDGAATDGVRTPPATDAEKVLADVWEAVLGVSGVAREDNFFALGGDSLTGIQVASRARQASLGITVRQLFSHPTLKELAMAACGTAVDATTADGVVGEVPLTPIQHFFFQQFKTDPHHFNHAVWIEVDPVVTPAVARDALQALAAHHEALRVTFTHDDTAPWRQSIAATPTVLLEEIAGADASSLHACVDAVQAGLELGGPLWRALYVHRDEGQRPRLLLVVHHLLIDVVSWGILLDDLARAIEALLHAQTPTLPPVAFGYGRWAQSLQKQADSPVVVDALPYWIQTLQVAVPWPAKTFATTGTRAAACECRLTLDEATTRAIERYSANLPGRHMESLLVGAWGMVMARRTGQARVALLVEGHGREGLTESEDLSRTIGWLTTRYPIALDAGDAAIEPILQRTDMLLGSLPHPRQTYGMARYLATSPEAATLRMLPEPNVLLNYLGRSGSTNNEAPDRVLSHCDGYVGESASPFQERDVALSLELRIHEGQLELRATGSPDVFSGTELQELAATYLEQIRSLARRPEAQCLSNHANADALTGTQRELVRQSLRAPSSGANTVQIALILRGALDVMALQRTCEWLCARHDVFRTAVHSPESSMPIWQVAAHAKLPLAVMDWRGRGDQEEAWQAFLEDDRRRPLPVGEAPLMRMTLIRMADDIWHLLWTQHHLIMDGWSGAVLLEELQAAYAALAASTVPAMRAAPSWTALRQRDSNRGVVCDVTFWQGLLHGCTLLPPVAAPVRYDQATFTFPNGLDKALNITARRHGITIHTICLAAWSILLARQHGRSVVAGFLSSGREERELAVSRMVAPLFQVLPCRADCARVPDDPAWLSRKQDEIAGVMARGSEQWRAALAHGESGEPAGVLAVQNYPGVEGQELPATSLSVQDTYAWEAMGYRLSARVVPGSPATLRVSYARPEYSPAVIEKMAQEYFKILQEMSNR